MLEISAPGDYRAGLYIRLSREDEGEGQSESVSNQLSLLTDFAAGRQLTVHDAYIDDGWSGGNFDRPNFKRLLADIESGQVNLVITKDLSRLGRDYILTGHYLERYFPEHRVRYLSLLDGIDTGVDCAANDITPFRAIMNDMYAKDISKKIKSVKRDKQRKGLFIGGKPLYGYRMHPCEKNKIVVDEQAAPTVRRIFAMALEGISCRQIANRLNSEAVPPPSVYAELPGAKSGPRGGLWSGERVSDMLQNETYIGNMVQGRSQKISYKSKKCVRQSRADWVVVPDTHEALIEAPVFRRVGELLDSRRSTRSRTYEFPLRGLIFCHECGHPLAVINRKNAGGEDCLYFVCRTYQRDTRSGACTSHTVREKNVTDAVAEAARAVCGQYLRAEALRPIADEALERARAARAEEREHADLRAKIEGLTARLDRMYLDKISGILDEGDFQRLYARGKAERAALEGRAAALSPRDREPDPGMAQALTERFLLGISANRELLTALVARVELTEGRQLRISFRFPPPEAALPSASLTLGGTNSIAH